MRTTDFTIKQTSFLNPKLQRLLQAHRETMQHYSPEESIHAVDITEVEPKDTYYYCLWDGEILAGCIALKLHNEKLAEVKSMKTSDNYLRKGVARILLSHLIEQAKQQKVDAISLETGTHSAFIPAVELYRSFKFEPCMPFADYVEDPNSRYMCLIID